MSMPAWLNDAAAVSNTDNGVFSPSVDPSMAFMHNPSPTPFDLNPLHSQPLHQRMQNGDTRHASPAFHNPIYQTNPIIPSKRPRPREGSIGASPRQAPGALAVSRSQTPHQAPYPGLPGSQHGSQHFAAPTPYQHLQPRGSSNATPSPLLRNQHFNPQGVSQRVQTASPNSFSPAAQNFPVQISPSHSDHGSRVNTPQNNHTGYMRGLSYGPGPPQHFTPPPGATSTGTPNAMPAQPVNLQSQLSYAQRDYQMRLQQNVQQNSSAALNRHPGNVLNPLTQVPNLMANHPMAVGQRQMQQPMQRPNNPEQFIRGLAQFMHARGLPLNTSPVVGGRPIYLMQLYAMVMKQGGSKKVTNMNLWPTIASTMQFPPIQYPSAAQEIRDHYQKNLAAWEAAYFATQQRQRMMSDQMYNMQQSHRGAIVGVPPQSSPVKQLNSQNHELSQQYMRLQQQTPTNQQTPLKATTTMHGAPRQPTLNGYLTPQQQMHGRQQNARALPHQTMSRPPEGPPPHLRQKGLSTPSTALSGRKDALAPRKKMQTPRGKSQRTRGKSQQNQMPRKEPIPSHYVPATRPIMTHGGIDVINLADLISNIESVKRDVPSVQELGVIDINALTMSLQSGIHAEVRLALDTLVALSVEQRFQLSLAECEDLVETLVDCAKDQVELLAENAAEVSDVMLISPYEEVVRACRAESKMLQEVPEFGTLEYNLDHAADRLICITTIIRNLSFFEANHAFLADPVVVKFMSTVVRCLGTRNMLLRTYRNTLDFMKDIVIYLSNLSHTIDLPGREEALCMIHFLLSFAPSPPPTNAGQDEVTFTSYDPSIHPYLPPAVDSLAKLLARDDPNRTLYKLIFAADVSSAPPYDLLSRTFALTIAPVPEHGRADVMPIVEARKPYLAQGLLAAEVLVSLIPGSDTKLARSWLSSRDDFPLSLLRIVCLLAVPQRHPHTGRMLDHDAHTHAMITNRGLAVLRRLAEKTKGSEQPLSGLRAELLPKKETLLSFLLNGNVDSHFVRQLCAYAGLGD